MSDFLPVSISLRWIAGQGELTSTGTDGLAFFKSKYNGFKQSGHEVPNTDEAFLGNDNRIRKREFSDASSLGSQSSHCVKTFNNLRLCKSDFGNNVTSDGRRRRALVGGPGDAADVEIMFIPASFATEGKRTSLLSVLRELILILTSVLTLMSYHVYIKLHFIHK